MSTDRFAERRAALLQQLGDTLAIVPAGREQTRNDDVDHPFRQDSDFHFLTGFNEPDAVAVLDPDSDEPYALFVRPRNPEKEAWNGLRAGVDGAMTRFGADAAFELDELDGWLRRRLAGRRSVAYTFGGRLDADVLRTIRSVKAYAARSGVDTPVEIVDLGALIAELRVIKSAAEIEALREACRISAIAHNEMGS